MELNANGLVKSASVRDVKRVVLKLKEGQQIRHCLALARNGKVRRGEIAVLGDREWLRVDSSEFHGSAWIEIG